MVLGITLKEAESVFVSKRDVDHCKCSCSLLVECNKSSSCKVIGQFRKKRGKQSDVSMQLTGKGIKGLSQSERAL